MGKKLYKISLQIKTIFFNFKKFGFCKLDFILLLQTKTLLFEKISVKTSHVMIEIYITFLFFKKTFVDVLKTPTKYTYMFYLAYHNRK